jgi:hypothetical protein
MYCVMAVSVTGIIGMGALVDNLLSRSQNFFSLPLSKSSNKLERLCITLLSAYSYICELGWSLSKWSSYQAFPQQGKFLNQAGKACQGQTF